MIANQGISAMVAEYRLLIQEMEAGLFPDLRCVGHNWGDFVPENWRPYSEILRPWFEEISVKGENEIMHHATLDFQSAHADEHALCFIMSEYSDSWLGINRDGEFVVSNYSGERMVLPFDPANPSSFLGVQVLRWVRWAFSCSYWNEHRYLNALPGTYFGIEVGTHLEGLEVGGFSVTTTPLGLTKEPQTIRPSIDVPDRICRAWLAAGCPERHIPGS